MDGGVLGQNAYFYDAAEGLLTATILLVAEFCAPEKRISVACINGYVVFFSAVGQKVWLLCKAS